MSIHTHPPMEVVTLIAEAYGMANYNQENIKLSADLYGTAAVIHFSVKTIKPQENLVFGTITKKRIKVFGDQSKFLCDAMKDKTNLIVEDVGTRLSNRHMPEEKIKHGSDLGDAKQSQTEKQLPILNAIDSLYEAKQRHGEVMAYMYGQTDSGLSQDAEIAEFIKVNNTLAGEVEAMHYLLDADGAVDSFKAKPCSIEEENLESLSTSMPPVIAGLAAAQVTAILTAKHGASLVGTPHYMGGTSDIAGPSTSKSDSIPAMLKTGETVFPLKDSKDT